VKSACWLLYVHLSARISTALSGQIAGKFDVENSHENVLRKSKFGYKWAKVSATLHEDPGMLMLLVATLNDHKSVLFK
jgi:hypothetical protein